MKQESLAPEYAKWTADEIVRLIFCILLAADCLITLAVDFGWVGLAGIAMVVLFIAGGMAS